MPIVLHILVNNSGVTWGEPLDTYPDSAFSKLMMLNVQRVFTMTQMLVPLLKKGSERDGVGRVINVRFYDTTIINSPSPYNMSGLICPDPQIGSINGISVPNMETYAYSASKAAVHQWVLFGHTFASSQNSPVKKSQFTWPSDYQGISPPASVHRSPSMPSSSALSGQR